MLQCNLQSPVSQMTVQIEGHSCHRLGFNPVMLVQNTQLNSCAITGDVPDCLTDAGRKAAIVKGISCPPGRIISANKRIVLILVNC